VRKLVQRHGWTFPVALDPQLQLFGLYRVAVCPTMTFAYKGGVVRKSTIHGLSAAQLKTEVAAIEKGPP